MSGVVLAAFIIFATSNRAWYRPSEKESLQWLYSTAVCIGAQVLALFLYRTVDIGGHFHVRSNPAPNEQSFFPALHYFAGLSLFVALAGFFVELARWDSDELKILSGFLGVTSVAIWIVIIVQAFKRDTQAANIMGRQERDQISAMIKAHQERENQNEK